MPDKLRQRKFHSTIITSVHIFLFVFVIEIHIGLFRNWNIVTLKSRPGRGEFFVRFPLSAFPGKFPNLLPWDAVSPPHARLPPECPSWVVSVSSAMFRFLDFMQYKKVTRKKGNSYSEFSTPLTSPASGNANSYKLITYKTLQYVQ